MIWFAWITPLGIYSIVWGSSLSLTLVRWKLLVGGPVACAPWYVAIRRRMKEDDVPPVSVGCWVSILLILTIGGLIVGGLVVQALE
jgi:hypothetical protein